MDNLFSEFKPSSLNEWLEVVRKDLKGKDIEKLNRITLDSLKFSPFYTKENTENLKTTDILPQNFPFIRGNKKSNEWKIRHDFYFFSLDKALEQIEFAKKFDVDIVGFNFNDDSQISNEIVNSLIEKSEVFAFNTYLYNYELFEILKNSDSRKKVFLNNDPVTQKAFTGGFQKDEQKVWTDVADMITNENENIKPIGINVHHFANAGATAVQQLAFALSVLAEYFDFATEMNVSIETIANNIYFNFAFGTEYFMEISKIRAFRYLYGKFLEVYDKKLAKRQVPYINGVTMRRNKTIYDAYVNMLRTTIEANAAIIGGVDSFAVEPFNIIFSKPDEFSNRIAFNQQRIIKEEAFANKVIDPAAGSYYVENITYKLIEAAWKLFIEIQDNGGFCDSLENNFIYELVQQVVTKEKQQVETGKISILGTNKYPNRNENLQNLKIIKPKDISDFRQLDVHFKTLEISRLSEDFEDLRMQVERLEKRSKVFLLTFGKLSMRRARADFAGNFFAVAGFEIIDNNGFEDAESALKAVDEVNPDIVVLCSSDDEYLDFAKKVYDKLKNRIIVVAGNPKSTEELKKLGIEYFIDIKSNIYNNLKKYFNILQ